MRICLLFAALWAAVPPAEALSVYAGNGADGELGLTVGRTENTVRTSVNAAVGAGATVLSVASGAGFAPGNLVLVIEMYGVVAGQYEFDRVLSTGAAALTLSRGLVNSYPAAGVQVIKVNEYSGVTIGAGANWTAPAWDGTTGGVFAAVVAGSVTMTGGSIDMAGRGFLFGAGGTPGTSGVQGQGSSGLTTGQTTFSNGSGGGAGAGSSNGGGGGGYGATGSPGGGVTPGDGGAGIGTADLSTLYMGGGGGGGGGHSGNSGGNGGTGGGIILLVAAGDIAVSGGVILDDGAGGAAGGGAAGGGGGGAGGAIRLVSSGTVTMGTALSAAGGGGGVGGGLGGNGAVGRIAVLSISTPTGSGTPAFDASSGDGVTRTDPYALPPSTPVFTAASSASLTASWVLTYPTEQSPVVVLSTRSDFSVIMASGTGSLGQQTTTWAVPFDNSTYYFKVKAASDPDSNFSVVAATINAIATPTGVYFDEISSRSITAAAYAPAPAFSNTATGASGVNIALAGNYQGWRAQGAWTSKASLLVGGQVPAAASLGGKVYVVGVGAGYTGNQIYDPVTNVWVAGAPQPTGRSRQGLAAVGGKLYSVGGYDDTTVWNANEEYDPESNSWSAKRPMPTARWALSAQALDGKIYAVGGTGGNTLNEAYDPANDTWATKQPLPGAMSTMASAVAGGKLYLLSGGTNRAYDPGANAWTSRAGMPSARTSLTAVGLGGKVYAIGGSGPLKMVEVYDPGANAWVPGPDLPTARSGLVSAAVGGRIYALAGYPTDTLNEMFDPGVSSSFTFLTPNTLYAFTAKARNQVGSETAETASSSTYTLAVATWPRAGDPLFTPPTASSVTVFWSSGTDAGGYNGSGATYLVQMSTTPDFLPVWDSSSTSVTSATLHGLLTQGTHYFRVRAYNSAGVTDYSWTVLASTLPERTPPSAPWAVGTWQSGSSSSLRVQWVTPGDDGTVGALDAGSAFRIQWTTGNPTTFAWSSAAAQVLIPTGPVNAGVTVSTDVGGLPERTTVYLRVWASDELGNWSQPSSTVSAFASPFSFETIAAAGSGSVSLAIDRFGNQHLAYRAAGTGYLTYVKRTGTVWGAPQTVFSVNSDGISLAVDLDGNPRVCFQNQDAGALAYAEFGTVWSSSTIDAVVGATGVLALDAAGNPSVAYSYYALGQLRFARRVGGNWSTEVVEDGTDNNGVWIGFALDGAGDPRIAYSIPAGSYVSSALRYAARTAGGAWTLTTVQPAAEGVVNVRLALEGNGLPRVTYFSYNLAAFKSVRYDGSSWSTPAFIESVDNNSQLNAMTLDGAGNTHVAYYTAVPKDLKYGFSADGVTWSTQTVDSAGDVGFPDVPVAVDGSGDVHIAYYSIGAGTVKAAHWTPAGFPPAFGGNPRGAAQAPSGLTATGVFATSVTWNWSDNASNEAGYRLYLSSAGSTDGAYFLAVSSPVLGPGSQALGLTGLLPNTSYQAYVAAVSSGGVAVSTPASAWTLAATTAPFDGSPPIAAVYADSATVAFASGAAIGALNGPGALYVVEASTMATFSPIKASSSTKNAFAVLTGLDVDATHYLRVKAVNNVAASNGYYLLGTTVTLANVPVGAASTFTAVSSGTISAAWGDNGNAAGATLYQVVLSTGQGYPNAFSGNRILSTTPAGPNPAATLGGLAGNSTYYLFVSAVNRVGTETSYAALGSTLTFAAEPAAAVPAFSSVQPGGAGEMSVEWSANGNPLGRTTYTVVLSSGAAYPNAYSGNLSVTTAPVGAQPAATLTGTLAANTTYYLFAAARNFAGVDTAYAALGATSSLANGAGSFGADYPFPKTDSSSMTVRFWGSGNPFFVTTYRVTLSTVNNEATAYPGRVVLSTVPQESGNDHWATLTGLAPNATYYLFVTALNHNGVPASGVTFGSTMTAVETPTAVVFEEVSTRSITAAAYAGGPAFSSMTVGLSGTDVAINGLYPGGHGEKWTVKADVTTPRYSLATVTIGGKVYAVGGYNGTTYFGANEVYDPVSGGWSPRAAMPTPRQWLAAAASGGKLYAFGGTNGSALTANEEYDPAADVWTSRAPLPVAREGLAAVAVGSKVYVLGGNGASNATTEYDPAADRWTARAAMPSGRAYMAAAGVGGKVYAVGGLGATSANEEFDPAANVWSVRANLPTPRYLMAGAAVGGKVYVIGGTTGVLRVNEEYDPLTNQWATRAAMPTARNDLAAAAAGGRIYAVGGFAAGALGANEEFDPGTASSFTALTPNTLYSFKALARNSAGTYTAESPSVSTYTLAAATATAAPEGSFWPVFSTSMTVRWASGTATGGFNGPGASYLVEVSTMASFAPVAGSSLTFATSAVLGGLSANATQYLRVRAFNSGGYADDWYFLGSTVTLANPALSAASTFTMVGLSSMTVTWDGNSNAPGTRYDVVFTTYLPFTAATTVSTTPYGAPSATATGLLPNATYYPIVFVYNRAGVASGETPLGSTVTLIEQPTTVVFEGISTHSIVAVATNSAGGFSNLAVSSSAVNIVLNGVPLGWVAGSSVAVSTGLVPNTLYQFKAKARNSAGTETAETATVSTYTLAAATVPQNGAPVFTGVDASSLTVNWSSGTDAGGYNGSGAVFLVQAATAPDFTSVTASSSTRNAYAVLAGLFVNATHHFRVQVANSTGATDGSWLALGSTVTAIEAPMAFEFDLVGSSVIVARATNSAGGFTSLSTGASAVDFSQNGVYFGWVAGSSVSFSTGLVPNTQYAYKARARNALAVETAESPSVSTYTLAVASLPLAGPVFSAVFPTSAAVHWSSGSAAEGFNAAGATYIIEASTAPSFVPSAGSYSVASTAAVVPGLSANASHYFRVRGVTAGGGPNPAWFALGSTVTAAFEPASLASTFSAVSTGSFGAAWSANGNPPDTLFEAAASTSAAFGVSDSSNVYVSTRPSGSPSAVFAGLGANTTYYLFVRAVNLAGTPTALAALGSTVTAVNPPDSAASTFSAVAFSSFTAAWSANGNGPGTRYLAVASTVTPLVLANANVVVATEPYGAPQAGFSGLTGDTTYFLFVAAVNRAGSPTAYLPLGSTVTAVNAPATAASTFTAVETSSAVVSWSANGNGPGTRYEVVTSTRTPLFAGLTDNVTASTEPFGLPSALLAGLAANTTHYLFVRALGRAGDSTPYTALGSTMTSIEAPASVFLAAVDSTSLTAVASAPAGAFTNLALSSSAVNISLNGVFQSWVAGSSVTVSSGLVPNTLYTLQAKARNQLGRETALTASASTRTLAATPSTATPTFPAVWVSSLGVQWTSNGNPAGTEYRLNVSTAADWSGAGDTLSGWSAAVSTAASGLTPNTTYYVRAAARNADGRESAWAALGATATLAAVPGPAASTFTAVSPSSLTLSWSLGLNPAGTEFRAQGSTSAAFDGAADKASPWLAALTTGFMGLSPDTTYYWRVTARNGAGVVSDPLDAGPQATSAFEPAASSEPIHAVWSSSANVQWGANGNPASTSYQATASTAADFSGPNLTSGWVQFLSTTVAGLTGDATYYFRVRARGVGGLLTAPLDLGATSTLAADPQGLTLAWAGPGVLRAEWSPAGNREAGPLGAWTPRTSAPAAAERLASTLVNGRLYIVGGVRGGSASAEVWSAGASPAGTLGAWRREADLPAPRESHALAVHAGRLYVVGGFDGSAKGTVYSADLALDGKIAAWATETSLPAARFKLAAAAYGGWLYAFGGDNGVVSQATVYRAPLAADGTVGAWAAAAALPAGRNSHAAAVSGGRVYVAGGLGAGTAPEVWSAVLDGPTVGPWTVQTPLAVPVFRHALLASGGALFVVGGHDGTAAVTDVRAAALSADGSVGAWQSLTALPAARFGHGAAVERGSLFVVGGADDAAAAAEAFQAPLGGTEYLLERAQDAGFSVAYASSGWRGGAGGDVPGLTPNTTYTLRLHARSRLGVEGAFVAAAATRTPAALPAATASTFSLVEAGSMTLTWADGGNPAGTEFLAALSTSPDFTAFLDTGWVTALSSAVHGLGPNTTYFASVLARDADGRRTRGLGLGATVTAAAVPQSGSFPSVLTTGLSVAWSTAANPPGTLYEAQLAAAASFTPLAASSVTLSSGAVFSGLQSATTYYLRVRAFNRAGAASAFSAATQAVTGADFTPPAAVTGLALHPTDASGILLAAWTAPGDDGTSGALPPGSRVYLQWAATPAGVAWSTANAQLSASTGPAAPGASASLFVTGLPVGSSAYARVWTVDESDNVSDPSAVASAWVSPFALSRLDGTGQDAGRWASVALDRTGAAHAAYTAGTLTQELRYMTRSAGVWSVAEAPDPGIPAEEVQIAAGPGAPQIVYRNSTTGQLRLAKRAGSWSAAAVTAGDLHPGGLAVDATGAAHISYFDAGLPGLRYARWNGAAWDLETVDAGAGKGRHSSLALDAASSPHIAYYDAAAGDLKYASRTAAGAWVSSTVDAAVDAGSSPVVALDGAGNAVVAYVDDTARDLKVARFDGLAWTLTVVDALSDVTAVRGLALDGAGRPLVTYYDGTSGDLLFARFNSTSWETGVVDGLGDVGAWSSLAAASDGGLLVLHYDAGSADLKSAAWSAGLAAPLDGNPRSRSQAPAAFSGVVSSATSIQWTWLDSAVGELGWRLYGGLTSTGPFSIVADTVALPATAGTGTQRLYTETGLTAGTTYYRYAAAVSSGGTVTSPMAALYPFNTTDTAAPTVVDNQAGDAVWRRAVGTLYNVDFQDTGGSALTKFQVKASTVPLGAGPDVAPYTDVVVNILADTYTADWALPTSVFNAMLDGATHYITVRAFDGAGNVGVSTDVFTVLKDTTPPAITDNQAGDLQRRAAAGTLYDVDVGDPASGLERFQYSVSTTASASDASVVPWTDVPLGASTTSFVSDWAVSFAALLGDSQNYVSVRAWDRAGSTAALADVFFVLKDTSGPQVKVTAPAASFTSALTVLSGTAADAAGVGGVQVAVQTAPPAGNWFDGASFASGVPVWLAASGTAAWTFAGVPAWTDGGAFRIVARATDGLGNLAVVYSTSDFTFDASTPTAGVTAPADGATLSALANIVGTAADPGPSAAGVAAVEVRWRRLSDGQYWSWPTGTWGASPLSTSPAAGTAWTLPVPETLRASLTDGASYFVSVRAVDAAVPANAGSLAVGSTFTWTDAAPPAAVTNLSALTGPSPGTLQLSWTAPGDDGAVGDLALGTYRIHYSTDPAAVFSTSAAQVAFSTAGVSPGLKQGRLVTGLTAGATYHVRVFLADDAGNWSALSNGATAYAGNQPFNKILGHVMKASSEGVTAVKIEAYDGSDIRVSQTFTLADGSGTFTLENVPDGAFKVQATWTADDITSSVWLDGVAVGSYDVDFMLEIDYTLSTLTGTLASLSAQAAHPAGFLVRAAENGFSDARVDLLRGGAEVAAVRPDPTGRWHIPNLLPGRYSVRAFNGLEYTDAQDVQLGEGETKEVVFVFDPLPETSVFAFPNPARTGTTFRFVSALPGLEAQVSVFDIAGTLVKEIPGSSFVARPGGVFHADWDLTNDAGESVASGVYLFMVKVKGNNGQTGKAVKKLAVVR